MLYYINQILLKPNPNMNFNNISYTILRIEYSEALCHNFSLSSG